MQFADLDEIAAIEREVPSPWSRDSLEREGQVANGLQLVVEDKDSSKILGWCCARLVGPEAELLKISVIRVRRRSGIASRLIAGLLRGLSARGVATLFLEVRSGNLPARQFYGKHGFREIGLRKKYYSQPDEDAVLFTKDLFCL